MSDDPLAEIRKRFRHRALADAEALSDALKARDFEAIEMVSHGLAGAAGLFGFTGIGDAAKAMDQQFAEGRPPSPAEIEALIATIRRDMDAYS